MNITWNEGLGQLFTDLGTAATTLANAQAELTIAHAESYSTFSNPVVWGIVLPVLIIVGGICLYPFCEEFSTRWRR